MGVVVLIHSHRPPVERVDYRALPTVAHNRTHEASYITVYIQVEKCR